MLAKTGIMVLYDSVSSDEPFKKLFMTRETLLKDPNVVFSNASNFFLRHLTKDIISQAAGRKDETLATIDSMNYQLSENASRRISKGWISIILRLCAVVARIRM